MLLYDIATDQQVGAYVVNRKKTSQPWQILHVIDPSELHLGGIENFTTNIRTK